MRTLFYGAAVALLLAASTSMACPRSSSSSPSPSEPTPHYTPTEQPGSDDGWTLASVGGVGIGGALLAGGIVLAARRV
ncbi:hypothetical protein Pan216_50250 [Planctomycetes bacterium Pan216]|uniref:Gram-positive cocci surface proteins LPxTG domain-containing protein n=1 Tax=Kolteria novifilia TaxID=2527975 RepID=A0A518BAX8_9BACT|nr:hypothetical protein Pan216_50250 [Planctomycetes bacterium Pan216]